MKVDYFRPENLTDLAVRSTMDDGQLVTWSGEASASLRDTITTNGPSGCFIGDRAIIKEVYYDYALYEERIIRYHRDLRSDFTTLGITGSDFPWIEIQPNLDYRTFKEYEMSASAAHIEPYYDIDWGPYPSAGVSAGSYPDNWVAPEYLGGLLHSDLSNAVMVGATGYGSINPIPSGSSITTVLDRDRANLTFAVDDWQYITGEYGSETNQLWAHYPLTDTGASSTLVEVENGYHATYSRNTAPASRTVNGKRDRWLETVTSFIAIPVGSFTDYFQAGAVMIRFKCLWDFGNSAKDQNMFEINYNSNNYIKCWIQDEPRNICLEFADKGSSSYSATMTRQDMEIWQDNDYTRYDWHTMIVTWNKYYNFAQLFLDGKSLDYINIAAAGYLTNQAGTFTVCKFLNDSDIADPGPFSWGFDSIKVFKNSFFPYGAKMVGNSGPNVTEKDAYTKFYWDGADCVANTLVIPEIYGELGPANTGSTTSFVVDGGVWDDTFSWSYFDNESNAANYYIRFPTADIFDFDFTALGLSISLWIQPRAMVNDDVVFSVYTDADNYFEIRTTTYGFVAVVRLDGTTYTMDSYPLLQGSDGAGDPRTVAVGDIVYLQLIFGNLTNPGSSAMFSVNKIPGPITNFAHIYQGAVPTYMYFGSRDAVNANCNFYLYRATITEYPFTPELPTVNGIPIHAPVKKITHGDDG